MEEFQQLSRFIQHAVADHRLRPMHLAVLMALCDAWIDNNLQNGYHTSLIAHDRAAFGGGLATIGLLYFFIVRKSDPVISLWQIVALSMTVGFSTAIGVHFFIGYLSFTHLLPAYFGAATSVIGLILTYRGMKHGVGEHLDRSLA